MTVINTKLYNGEVQLSFESFRHKYTVTDPKFKIFQKSVTSVTKALGIINKPALINWAAKMAVEHIQSQIESGKSYDEVQLLTIFEAGKKAHWQKKVDAGNIGTFVHNWVEDYINGKKPAKPVNKDLKDAIENFLDWVKKHKVKFLIAEQQVYSRKHIYTGTLDFICTIDGKMYIGDLKTSSGIYPEMLIQTAAYRHARSEEYPKEKYVGQIIVRVGKKDGTIEVAIIKDEGWYKKMFEAFLSALQLQKSMELMKEFKTERL